MDMAVQHKLKTFRTLFYSSQEHFNFDNLDLYLSPATLFSMQLERQLKIQEWILVT